MQQNLSLALNRSRNKRKLCLKSNKIIANRDSSNANRNDVWPRIPKGPR